MHTNTHTGRPTDREDKARHRHTPKFRFQDRGMQRHKYACRQTDIYTQVYIQRVTYVQAHIQTTCRCRHRHTDRYMHTYRDIPTARQPETQGHTYIQAVNHPSIQTHIHVHTCRHTYMGIGRGSYRNTNRYIQKHIQIQTCAATNTHTHTPIYADRQTDSPTYSNRRAGLQTYIKQAYRCRQRLIHTHRQTYI